MNSEDESYDQVLVPASTRKKRSRILPDTIEGVTLPDEEGCSSCRSGWGRPCKVDDPQNYKSKTCNTCRQRHVACFWVDATSGGNSELRKTKNNKRRKVAASSEDTDEDWVPKHLEEAKDTEVLMGIKALLKQLVQVQKQRLLFEQQRLPKKI